MFEKKISFFLFVVIAFVSSLFVVEQLITSDETYKLTGSAYVGNSQLGGVSTYSQSNQMGQMLAVEPKVEIGSVKITNRATGLSHGKSASRVVREYKALTNNQNGSFRLAQTGDKRMNSSRVYAQGALTNVGTHTSSGSYSSLHPANSYSLSGKSSSASSSNALGMPMVSQQSVSVRRLGGLGGMWDDSADPNNDDQGNQWVVYYHEYVDAGLTSTSYEDLWNWWEEKTSDGMAPIMNDEGEAWVKWMQKWLPIGNVPWVLMLLLIAAYVAMKGYKNHKTKLE